MAECGNTYTVSLKPSHLDWGEYRHSTNRDFISGEGYIPIPRKFAVSFKIYNSNYSLNEFGVNLFYASSVDGFLKDVILLAQGSCSAGDIYAKQFSVQGNLRMIGSWYKSQNAGPDNSVKVTWIDKDKILLEIC